MLKALFSVFLIVASSDWARCQDVQEVAPGEDHYFEALPFKMEPVSLPGLWFTGPPVSY